MLSTVKNRIASWRYNRGSRLKYYNFWSDQTPAEMWLTLFIAHQFAGRRLPRVNFVSVLGSADAIHAHRPGRNIFYTGENIHAERFSQQRQAAEKAVFDLRLGFDYCDDADYLRLPLWLLWTFPPQADEDGVRRVVDELNRPHPTARGRFAALVCGHDAGGVRGQIMDALTEVAEVASAGAFRRNTDELHTVYGNDKLAFLRHFRFTVCPENSDAEGYVTEKLFDAIAAGCIPIYTGSGNNPEPGLINKDAVLFWNNGTDNRQLVEQVGWLNSHAEECVRFAGQDRLMPNAGDVVWGYYTRLRDHLRTVLF
ncbi:MAG: hypothetical protein IJ760_00820 [Bacteroidales bacterium]|nr:hypothetical protein [Bacteroidales bacterium]